MKYCTRISVTVSGLKNEFRVITAHLNCVFVWNRIYVVQLKMESLTVQCACQVILLCPISFVLILQYRNMAFYSLLHPSTFYYILLHPATYYNIPHVLLCPPTTSYVFDLLPHHTTTIPYLVLLHPTVLLLCPTTTLYYAILHPTF